MRKSKIFMIVSISILCISIIGSSYAYYQKVLFDDLQVDTITYGLDYYINYNKGTDITSGTLNPSADYTGGNSATIELWKKDNTYDIYGHIYLDISEIGSNLKNSPYLKYAVLDKDNNVISSGSVSGHDAGTSILLKGNIPLVTTKELYTVYVWLEENNNLDSNIESETISASIRCEATMKTIVAG